MSSIIFNLTSPDTDTQCSNTMCCCCSFGSQMINEQKRGWLTKCESCKQYHGDVTINFNVFVLDSLPREHWHFLSSCVVRMKFENLKIEHKISSNVVFTQWCTSFINSYENRFNIFHFGHFVRAQRIQVEFHLPNADSRNEMTVSQQNEMECFETQIEWERSFFIE